MEQGLWREEWLQHILSIQHPKALVGTASVVQNEKGFRFSICCQALRGVFADWQLIPVLLSASTQATSDSFSFKDGFCP